MCQVCVGRFVQIFHKNGARKTLLSFEYILSPTIAPKSLYILGIYSSFSHRISLQHLLNPLWLMGMPANWMNMPIRYVCIVSLVTWIKVIDLSNKSFFPSWLFLLKNWRLSATGINYFSQFLNLPFCWKSSQHVKYHFKYKFMCK